MRDQEPIPVEQAGRAGTVAFHPAQARNALPLAVAVGTFAARFSLGLLAAAVGPVRAREIALTARLVSGAGGEGMGLVDEVHEATALRGRVKEPAALIAELGPLPVGPTKEAVRR